MCEGCGFTVVTACGQQHTNARANAGIILDDGYRSLRNVAGLPVMISLRAGAHKHAPPCVSFAARMLPPCEMTISLLIASPRPVPSPGGLVVKNGSNSRGRADSCMPGPVSRIATSTHAASGRVSAMNRSPRPCIACAAFVSTLQKTCWSWLESPRTASSHQADNQRSRLALERREGRATRHQSLLRASSMQRVHLRRRAKNR